MTGDASDRAALVTLTVVQVVMLGALFAGVPPHPPETTPLFGMAPFLAASIAASISAVIVGRESGFAGRILFLAGAILALVSFGPHKYFDAQFPLIWPAVVSGQIAVVTILIGFFKKGVPNDRKGHGGAPQQ